jgi:hypothetical protein
MATHTSASKIISEGGSAQSGFVQRMIAEKKVKIKKVKKPSQWLLNNQKAVSAPRTKQNIELVIEEEPPKKAKKAKLEPSAMQMQRQSLI